MRLVTRETDGLDSKSLLYNGQEVEKASIDLTGGVVGELEPVLTVLARDAIEGTVLLPEGREQSPMEPGDELWVRTGAGEDTGGYPTRSPWRWTQTAISHSRNLAPGTDRAFAVASDDPGLWQNADFVRDIASLARSRNWPKREVRRSNRSRCAPARGARRGGADQVRRSVMPIAFLCLRALAQEPVCAVRGTADG